MVHLCRDPNLYCFLPFPFLLLPPILISRAPSSSTPAGLITQSVTAKRAPCCPCLLWCHRRNHYPPLLHQFAACSLPPSLSILPSPRLNLFFFFPFSSPAQLSSPSPPSSNSIRRRPCSNFSVCLSASLSVPSCLDNQEPTQLQRNAAAVSLLSPLAHLRLSVRLRSTVLDPFPSSLDLVISRPLCRFNSRLLSLLVLWPGLHGGG